MSNTGRCSKLVALVGLINILTVVEQVATQKNDFIVYWNVPTFQCRSYGYNFTQLNHFGITQNSGDKFRGESITILYDPGYYPAIIDGKDRNGGLPQEGNLEKHLTMFKKDVLKAIPDPDFNGVGIIDFEHWRPIFRENWASLDIYRRRTREMVKIKYPYLDRSAVEKMATQIFEKSSFPFMNETLALAIRLRPNAMWGYYAFPYCFNFSPKNLKKECTPEVKVDNDKSTWMYKTGTAVYPSVYLQQKVLNEAKRAKLIQYRTLEGNRIAEMAAQKLKQYTYIYFKYTDTGEYLSKGDMKSSILEPMNAGSNGVIIWGSSSDVNSAKKCDQLYNYIEKVIRPILKSANLQNIRSHENEI
uniref:Hyaluronidase n=1 Tax=Ectomocoris sp. TaxID=3104572 RepID=A0AB38ZE73_9HEMI